VVRVRVAEDEAVEIVAEAALEPADRIRQLRLFQQCEEVAARASQ
jgi:hypothetical protein